MKSKIKTLAKQVSIPTQSQTENAKTILNLQFGKVILQIKRE